MGYNTYFYGQWTLDRPLDDKTAAILRGLNETRRVKRDVSKIGLNPTDYGEEGEFYFPDPSTVESKDRSILDYNTPPVTQPSLWCQWMYNPEDNTISWDKGEKFYSFVEWIQYIIEKVLVPMGIRKNQKPYLLNGTVTWDGEGRDSGSIVIIDNKIEVHSEIKRNSNTI
jgi:hypothetical protein